MKTQSRKLRTVLRSALLAPLGLAVIPALLAAWCVLALGWFLLLRVAIVLSVATLVAQALAWLTEYAFSGLKPPAKIRGKILALYAIPLLGLALVWTVLTMNANGGVIEQFSAFMAHLWQYAP